MVKHFATKYDNTRRDCKCYQVGVRFDLKDMLYDPNFWPNGVAYRRFDFESARRDEPTEEGF